MVNSQIVRRFNFDIEIQRNDVPSNGVGDFLDREAIELAFLDTGTRWKVGAYRLIVDKDEPRIYEVTLEPALL